MGKTLLLVTLLMTASPGGGIPRQVVEKQNESFQQWWGEGFVWKFEDLPVSGNVDEDRVPYSGYIYPDNAGGTSDVLRKYDQAFTPGSRYPATEWERRDTTSFKKPVKGLLGIFGRRETPNWYGHCNGWTAAAIRHAEPQRSVRSNGVVFTPSDIKALLAELYIYNDIDMLAGFDHDLNAGTFHAIIANWLGRGSHPIGVDVDPGEEKWNYPLYAFASSYKFRTPHLVEVNTNIRYAKDSEDGEYEESPRLHKTLFCHYVLNLNERGEIVGGRFFDDSSLIDMLWVPLRPKQAGQVGNELGNPHIQVDLILALWRKSVSVEVHSAWMTIDPAPQDRELVFAERPQLVARGTIVTVPSPLASEESVAAAPVVRARDVETPAESDVAMTPSEDAEEVAADVEKKETPKLGESSPLPRARIRVSDTVTRSGGTVARWLE